MQVMNLKFLGLTHVANLVLEHVQCQVGISYIAYMSMINLVILKIHLAGCDGKA